MILLFFACGPDLPPPPVTETGNPERVMGVAASPVVAPTGGAAVDSAWTALHETKLVLDEQYVGEHELEWETPDVVADLAAGPVDLRFRSPNAGYTTVIVRPRTGRDRPAEAPEELEDFSFVVEGTTGDGTPFRILSETEEELELTRPFDLDRDQRALALGFDTDRWLDGLDFATAELDGGTIRIEPGSNEALLDAFEANLGPSLRLVEDLDEDGRVGQDEPVLSEP